MRALRLFILLCLASTPALAGDAKQAAKGFYEDGLKQYNLGHFEKALADFESAYQVLPDAVFLFNIGQCHRALGRSQEALLAYRAYLREAPNAPNREEVERLRTELEQTLERQRQQQEVPPTGTLSPGSAQPGTVTPDVKLAPAAAAATAPVASDHAPAARRNKVYWIVGVSVGVAVVAALGIGLGVGLSSSRPPSPTFAMPLNQWTNQ
jgi:tetratricopeptide (TPR) repeat protein